MKLVNCDIFQFKQLIKGKNLVCFGAGTILREFILKYGELHLEQEITCIADNQPNKAGTEILLGSRQIPVIGVDRLIRMKNTVILISCSEIAAVYAQLSEYQELDDVWCLAVNYIISETNRILDEKRWYPSDFKRTGKPLIPKKIHYCWFGEKEIPDKNRKWMDSWKKYCPDYEIIRWDEKNYDVTANQYMYDAYKAEKWGFVPDYARLDIIYRHGGVYLDTDVELVKSLDDLLYQKAFAGIDGSNNISLGLGFGAQKGCGLIKELRDLYNNWSFLKKDGSCDLTACPTRQKAFYHRRGYRNDGQYQILDGVMTIYPEKVFSAKCNYTGRILPTPHTFAIHHYDGSWTTPEKKEKIRRNNELFEKARGIFCNTDGQWICSGENRCKK